jgi:hypothetical protein
MKTKGRRGWLIAFFCSCLLAARGQDAAVREVAPGVFFWQGDHIRKVPVNRTWIVQGLRAGDRRQLPGGGA